MTEDEQFKIYTELKLLHWMPMVLSALTFICLLGIIQLISVSDKDQFGVAIAILQTLMAAAAFAGFWAVRGSAIQAARKAAKDEMKEFTKNDCPSIIRRYVNEWMEANSPDFIPTDENLAEGVQNMIDGFEDA